MDAFVILNKEYSVNDPMFVKSIAVSSSSICEFCIHTDNKLYDFYNNKKDYDIIFVKDLDNNRELREIVDRVFLEKDLAEKKYEEAVRTINKLDKYYGK